MKESDQIGEKSKEKKELAAKAKKKFLENLSKFQKEIQVTASFDVEDKPPNNDNFRRASLRCV